MINVIGCGHSGKGDDLGQGSTLPLRQFLHSLTAKDSLLQHSKHQESSSLEGDLGNPFLRLTESGFPLPCGTDFSRIPVDLLLGETWKRKISGMKV